MFRTTVFIFTLGLVAPCAARAQADAFPLRALNIEFGIKDHEAHTWDGSVSVSTGEIVKLRGHHFKETDSIGPDNSWKAATEPWIGHGGGMHPNELPFPHPTRVVTLGVTLYYRAPEDAEIRVKTAVGDFAFKLSNVPAVGPLHLLSTKVEVFRVPPVETLTTERYEDDYPSLAAGADGTVSLAWIGYRDEADQVFFRQQKDGAWGETMTVTEKPGDLYGTDVAVDGAGRVWVAWSERDGGAWRVKARRFERGSWSATETLTPTAGNNLFHRLVAGGDGSLHLSWQSARRGRSDIYYRRFDGRSWSEELNLSDGTKDPRANDWFPDLAVDSKGVAWVVWDSYDGGSYNILMRPVRSGKAGKLLRVTDSARYHAHASIEVDGRDRVWIAYDESEENWAKDNGFLITGGAGIYQNRAVRVVVWDGAQWLAPRDDINRVIRPSVRRYVQSPRLAVDSKGRMWAFIRPRTSARRPESLWAAGGKWEVMATYYSGDRWSHPITLPESIGRNEGPFDAAALPDGSLRLAWVSDQRPWGGPNFGYEARDNQVLVADPSAQLAGGAPRAAQLAPRGAEPPTRLPVEPREAEQVAAIRAHSIEAGGKTYKIYRGDLHRHTDISLDGAGDGSLFASFRYTIDAAAMDFYLVTDHKGSGDTEYNWWRTEKAEDMFHVPGVFTPLFGYERSLGYPNGHRNVIYAKRGNRPIPITAEERMTSTGKFLYPKLRLSGGITTSHTSHTSMGTDWRDNDPELEPIVEIFQGARTSAEHEGAPLSPSKDRTDLWAGNYRPLGFVWNAWAKGYKLGVQASSDHVSTHTSYAMVLAEQYTRAGLLEAMRKRHTYAATSNIILDFRVRDGARDYIHGDEFSTDAIPEIRVRIRGTAPIKEVAIVRDNTYIHKRPGSGERMDFTFREQDLAPGEHYYYVRVEQEDKNVAWASPVWVRLR